jgi:hypothetical protein
VPLVVCDGSDGDNISARVELVPLVVCDGSDADNIVQLVSLETGVEASVRPEGLADLDDMVAAADAGDATDVLEQNIGSGD